MTTAEQTVANRFQALESLKVPFESYLAEIQTVVVETPEQYEAAGLGLTSLKTWEKDITAYFEPERLRTFTEYDAVTKTKKGFLDKAAAVEKIIKGKMGAYMLAENEKRRLAQIEADKAAAKARSELAASMPTPENPVAISTVVIPEVPQMTKVAGVSVRETWKFSVTNTAEIKESFWTLNEALILKVVKDLGPEAEKVVGGIKVEKDIIMGARG